MHDILLFTASKALLCGKEYPLYFSVKAIMLIEQRLDMTYKAFMQKLFAKDGEEELSFEQQAIVLATLIEEGLRFEKKPPIPFEEMLELISLMHAEEYAQLVDAGISEMLYKSVTEKSEGAQKKE